ncbi:MAG: TlpA disulfide reductase family protein [Cyclobacteriaceae bacterium]
MRKVLCLIILLTAVASQSQNVEVIKFPELHQKMISADAPLTIFNFWATWCGPCVKEMPHFEAYANDENVKVYLVSLDFIDQLDRVKKFVESKGIKSEVFLLNETDYDSYMDKVSKEWSGAIPATLFIDEWGTTHFHESEFSKEGLDKAIKQYLN